MIVQGPLAIAQLLETTIINLVSYPSLIATNARRIKSIAGDNVKLSEFGLRRAQGPDGGLSASQYSYLGGFDSTSNVLCGKAFGIPVAGTMAHSFVTSFTNLGQVKYSNTNDGELASFIAFAFSYPKGCLCLIDSYDTLASGVKNFICVAAMLDLLGYKALGVRLDSGDLASLSINCKKEFSKAGSHLNLDFSQLIVVASDDINEEKLKSLIANVHFIDSETSN